MVGSTALKKINARVKVLQKKHPKSKRVTLQKQAGKEYKAGKLKAHKKRGPKKVARKKAVTRRKKPAVKSAGFFLLVKSAPRKRARRVKKTAVRARRLPVTTPRAKRKYKARKTRVKSYTGARYRRVTGTRSNSLVPLMIGGIVLLGAVYFLLKPKPPAVVLTTNATRNAAGNNLLLYLTGAGLALNLITKIMDQFNSSDDNTAISLANNPAATVAALSGPTADTGLINLPGYTTPMF